MASPRPPGVYIDETAFTGHTILGAATSASGFIGEAVQGPMRQAVQITSFAEYQHVFGGLQTNLELGYAVRLFFDNGGTDSYVVRVHDQTEVPKALSLLDAAASTAVLCVPGCFDVAILNAAAAYCDQRRIFLVVDPPSSDVAATKALAAALQATGTSNAAVYFPQISIADPTSPHAPRLSSPSGAVAGMIARTDTNRGVWTAPAGMDAQLVSVLSLPFAIDQTAAASLAAAGVNSIRSVPHRGTVVWAAQTVSSQDQWKYVPVRRLTLFIERSLVNGMQWAIFEPNDEPLWAQLATQVSTFLSTLWHQGAFSGKTQQEAYLVKSGREVMTQNDIDQGAAIVVADFAPVNTTETVALKITVQTR